MVFEEIPGTGHEKLELQSLRGDKAVVMVGVAPIPRKERGALNRHP